MAAAHTIVVNGKKIRAAHGETLLDAAMAGRVVIPHDCCTGQCNSCRVRVYSGEVDDGGTRMGDTVLACRTLAVADAVIEFDEVPSPSRRVGSVTDLRELTDDIVEIVVTLRKRLDYLPGQYVKAAFAGLPERDYSPTLRLDGSAELNELVFHIRREPGGVVSSELGRRVRPGADTAIRGPFGSGYHRPGPGRLVLISTGTGWAPIWAIARAARFREPAREMVVIAGARKTANLYMRESLEWLAGTGVGRIVATTTDSQAGPDMKRGRPTQHLPILTAGDTIHAAGAPGMVAAVELLAAAGDAVCHADPFVPAVNRRLLRHRLADLLPRALRVAG